MQYHQQLNPKIWNKDNTLKEEVYDKLLEISDTFIEFLEIPEDSIQDIILVGSSANYNYTDFSDIDVHLIVDYEKVHEDCPLVQGYLWAFKTMFNEEHDITIYDIPVEMYAEDSNTPRISNGVYSLLTDEWLSKPEKVEITVDDNAVKKKYEELKETIDKTDDSEKAVKLLRKIYDMRKAGLQEEGEFSIENLVFKELRNNKDIDKLWDLKKKEVDKKLSLGESRINEIDKIHRAQYCSTSIARMKKYESINESGYNWNKGMSNNAIDAYNQGEKPLSKWTKHDIIDSLQQINISFELEENLKKLNIKELREVCLEKTSWHHISKYYNKTDFYSLIENKEVLQENYNNIVIKKSLRDLENFVKTYGNKNNDEYVLYLSQPISFYNKEYDRIVFDNRIKTLDLENKDRYTVSIDGYNIFKILPYIENYKQKRTRQDETHSLRYRIGLLPERSSIYNISYVRKEVNTL